MLGSTFLNIYKGMVGVFNNFSSKDFAKVLLVEEMAKSSLSQIVTTMMREGIEIGVVSKFFGVQRRMLGLREARYDSYLELLTDDLIINSVRYFGRCEELKLVLVLYSVENAEAIREGDRVDVFNLLRVVKGLGKFLSRSKSEVYNFKGYYEVLRNMM